MPPVFRCVASRNKRKTRLIGNFEPGLGSEVLQRFCAPAGARGPRASPGGRPATRVARLGPAGSGPLRLHPTHSQQRRPIRPVAHPEALRAWATSPAVLRTAKALLNPLPFRAARSPGGPKAQRASPATLRVARAQPNSPPVRPRRVPPLTGAFGHPEIAASTPKPRPAIPLGIALLTLRPVSASLRLRFHSAAFSRALAEILSKRALTRLDDFLLQRSRAGAIHSLSAHRRNS